MIKAWSDEAWEEFEYWTRQDRKTLKRILELIKDIDRNCYEGIGKPERLVCGKMTEILTYIKFDDGTDEDLVFPWDKKRLNKNKSPEGIMAHMENANIEYYPIKVIGSDKEIDELMLNKFPEKIQTKYSGTQKRRYPMNICQYCGAKQGEYFIYEWVNKAIQKMEALPVFQMIESEKRINQDVYREQNAKALKEEYLKPKRSEVKGKNQIYIY